MKKIIIFFIFAFFWVLPVNAQLNLPTDADFLTIKISPENLRPNQQVTASIEFYLTDLKRSEISWFLNGELQKKDFGATTFKFPAGSTGTAQKIMVSILTFEGKRVTKEITLRPASVDIVWNANTYTPPFYKGRAILTGRRGNLDVVAIPNIIDSSGRMIDRQFLVYNWYKDDTFLKDQSGYGKNKINIKQELIGRPFNVKVVVENLDGSIVAQRTIRIDYEEPKVLIYEKHPLYGILFNQAVMESNIESNEEVTFTAIPFFFSTPFKNNSSINYTWTQNGRIVSESPGQNTMTFRKLENNSTGQVNVSVKVSNKEDFTQIATEDFKVISDE